MRRIGIGVAVVVAIVAAVLLWRRSQGASDEGGPADPVASAVAGRGLHATGETPSWFAAKNVPARRIAGRVTFEAQPVPDASVVLTSLLTRAGVVPPAVRRTDAQGRFDFGDLPAAVYMVGASAPERIAAIVTVDLTEPTRAPPPEALELRLRGCIATLHGTVVDGSGGVVAHARILRDGVIGTEADAGGTYRLCLPAGEAELEFSAAGYGAVHLTVVARGNVRRDVALVPEAVIVGRVLLAPDESPVAGALVSATPREWGRDRAANRQSTSGADGRFRIDGLAPGMFRVHARHDGMSTVAAAQALAEAGAESQEVVLRLEPLARLHGVVNEVGRPVAGVAISAVRRSPIAYSQPATTQKDGSFIIELAPRGEIVFNVAGYEVVSPESYRVDANEHRGIAVEVTRMAAIRGRVARQGRPVEGARVCCGQADGRGPTTSNEDGRYAFEGLPAGAYEIMAQTDEAFANPRTVTLRAGEQRDDVDIDLDQAGTIAGDVVDQRSRPVPGVMVRFVHDRTGDLCNAVTDVAGKYRCGAMTGGGRYVAKVFASADARNPFSPAPGTQYPSVALSDAKAVVEGVRIRIERELLAISGTVVDTDGAEVADARVQALAAADGRPPQFFSWLSLPGTVTDATGSFSIGGLTKGTYAVQARSARGGEATSNAVAAGTAGVRLVLEEPGAIDGRLVGFADPPAVYATPVGSTFRLNAGVVSASTFRVAGLRPGRYLVNAQTTYEGQAATVDVSAGDTASVVLTAGGRGAIRGRVVEHGTGAPVAGAICHAVTSSGGYKGITNWDSNTAPKSDAGGIVVLDPAPAGPVIVECNMPSFRHSPPAAELVVPRGGLAEVALVTVRLAVDYPGTVGLGFDWWRVAPFVSAVVAGGPAAKAGVLPGDRVVAVDGAAVTDIAAQGVLYLIEGRPAGATVALTLQRGAEAVIASMRTAPRSE